MKIKTQIPFPREPGKLLLMLGTSFILLMAACQSLDFPIIGASDNGEESNRPESNNIVGIWEWMESAQGEGTTVGDPTSVQTPNANDRRTLQFNSNGTYIWQQTNDNGDVLLTDAGTWRGQGSDLIYNEDSQRVTYQYEIANNRLTLTRISVDGEFGYWLREKWQRK